MAEEQDIEVEQERESEDASNEVDEEEEDKDETENGKRGTPKTNPPYAIVSRIANSVINSSDKKVEPTAIRLVQIYAVLAVQSQWAQSNAVRAARGGRTLITKDIIASGKMVEELSKKTTQEDLQYELELITKEENKKKVSRGKIEDEKHINRLQKAIKDAINESSDEEEPEESKENSADDSEADEPKKTKRKRVSKKKKEGSNDKPTKSKDVPAKKTNKKKKDTPKETPKTAKKTTKNSKPKKKSKKNEVESSEPDNSE